MYTVTQRFTMLIRNTFLLMIFVLSNTVDAALVQDISIVFDGPAIGSVTLPSEAGHITDCDKDITNCTGFLFSFRVESAFMEFNETNVSSAWWEIDDKWQVVDFELFASDGNTDVTGCGSDSTPCILTMGLERFLLITEDLSAEGTVFFTPVHSVPEPSIIILLSIGLLGFRAMQDHSRRQFYRTIRV